MRFTRRRGSGGNMLNVEITPMIDVVFLLIIFFMITAQFAELVRADVELPRERGEQEQTSDEAGLIINLDREGAIIVSDETLTLDELISLVRERISRLPGRDPAELKLMLRADRNASTARLNDVIRRLEREGVGAARLATEVPR